MRTLAYEGYNWVECLTLVELVLINAVAESTDMSPAHITYGQSWRMPIDHLDGMHPV